jgi:hypothetical protein
MIDSRYHLVSIVGVFLALAIGIVLGSTELQGPTYDVLNTTTGALQNDLDQAIGLRDAAQGQLSFDQAYATSVEPVVLRGLLAGQRLVIITEPGAPPSVVTALANAATSDAGATVTGQITLQPALFNTGITTEGSLQQVNLQMAHALGITLDKGETCQQQAAQILATEIMTKSAGSAPSQRANADGVTGQTMLAAYAGSGFLTMSGQPATRATIAVVVTPQISPTGGSLDLLLVALAQELAAKGSATAVASSSTGSGSGSPIAVLRASNAASQVSTIDNADFVTGQTMVIQALATQLSGGKPGSYGTEGNGPIVVTPSPAATPRISTAGK